MNVSDKIYVAGHRGLAGSALVRRLQAAGFTNLVFRTHAELDLTDQAAVRKFFAHERPVHVFIAAAKVGGIHANSTQPADFIHQNLAIEQNVIEAAWRHGAARLLFLGSSCIYPRECPQPIKESYLLTGPLEPTNRPYAIAKIAGIEMCWSLNRQHGTHYMTAMPTNLYGPNDNYDLNNSHVLPALIRKAHEAKARGDAELVVWGTGAPHREFLYSDDMADACILLMQLPGAKFGALINPAPGDWSHPPLINVGCGEDLTIRALAQTIVDIVGFKGKLVFDTTKPDGSPRKLLDISRMAALGWQPRIGLREGIDQTYLAYVATLQAGPEQRR
ncbi:MAG: GDP-L-fucose synthase [Betaproteobacteria bacterium]|nr:GDP-L-fucose synthase [Betaproteobacteria bacterium]